MVSLWKKGLNRESMFQDEEGKPVAIASPGVIFHEVLEELSNRKKNW